MNLTERSKQAQERLNKAGLAVDAAYAELEAAVTEYVAARLAEKDEIRQKSAAAGAAMDVVAAWNAARAQREL